MDDEDQYALVEKIIKDVDYIMCRNSELSSFDIVPVERNIRNKSPVLHEENCLGLELWCVKHVYMFCYSEIFDKYISQPKKKSLKVSIANADRIRKLLNMILLINPDLSSLWNRRRDMLKRSLLNMPKELQFTMLVLSRKPKCNDVFSYRRWILDNLFEDAELQSDVLENLVTNELYICKITAEKSPNNYHSWNHRIWLINKLKNLTNFNINSQYIKEYDFSQKCISRHVSDFSCFHYRQYCIRNICHITNENVWKYIRDVSSSNLRNELVSVIAAHFPEEISIQASKEELVSYSDEKILSLLLGDNLKPCSCVRNKFLIFRRLETLFHELVLSNELIKFYEHHETLWYHRRFIVHEILQIMYGYFSLARQDGVLVKVSCACQPELNRQPKIVRYDSNCIYNSVLFNVLLSHEMAFVAGRRSAGDNYADRHEKYLTFVKGFNNTGN